MFCFQKNNKNAVEDFSTTANPHLSETSPSDKYFLLNEGDTHIKQDV